MKPSTLFIRHLQRAMERMTKSSMMKRRTMAQKRPLLLTATGWNLWMMVYRSQGSGSLWGREAREQADMWEKAYDVTLVSWALSSEEGVFIGSLWLRHGWPRKSPKEVGWTLKTLTYFLTELGRIKRISSTVEWDQRCDCCGWFLNFIWNNFLFLS